MRHAVRGGPRHAGGPERIRDRGVASLEVVALYPILILVATFALQAAAAVWTATVTSEAARVAARAYALGDDPTAAANGSLPGGLSVDSLAITGAGDHAVQLRVQVPRVSVLPRFTVTRSAVMP